MIHNKWKLFAFGQFFKNDLTVEEALKLFEELVSAHSPYDCEEILQAVKNKVRLWPEHRFRLIEDVIDDMYELAQHAQQVEFLEI